MWEIIENELKKQNMNQESLSKKMNVHSGIVSDFKKGRIKKPSFELMCKFADALGISLDNFRKRNE
ncbi:helix-turn-helix domain-containing protein [Enterococcus faecalis]|uniref:helix-turn-helix domain-containing protein n=1 Tax=Enterococcus faecalis TaxID=1351 RepID=UPI001574AE4D|nr:helix-turn-helix transcriptional regulator [Enterococcus faecalis]HAP2895826.1 helix-turn-helix transcriptional regulator [Enterococcus faecalis]HAP4697842.1 helix-turn-helix transcriptional regulator [Enterococcus faecalis]